MQLLASAAVAEEVAAEVIAQSATACSWLASAQISQGHGSLGFIPSSSIYVYSPVSHSHQVWVYSLHGSRSCLRPLSENLRLWGGRCPSLLSSWCPGGVPAVVSRFCPGGVSLVSQWCPGGVPLCETITFGKSAIVWSVSRSTFLLSWCPGGVPVLSRPLVSRCPDHNFRQICDCGVVGVPAYFHLGVSAVFRCPGVVPVSQSTFILVSLRYPACPNHWCASGVVSLGLVW